MGFAAAPSVSMIRTVIHLDLEIDTVITSCVCRGPEPIEDTIDIEDRSYKYVIDGLNKLEPADVLSMIFVREFFSGNSVGIV